MNYTNQAAQELTASLQELAARRAERQGAAQEQLPRRLAVGDLVFSREIESFLEKRRLYAERTRDVSVGVY